MRNNSHDRPKKRLYTVVQASEYLGLSIWSVRKRISDRQIPYVSVGRRVMLDIYKLDEWIEEHEMVAKR